MESLQPRLIWGGSRSMIEIRENLRSLSRSDSSVLIVGETGTGKGMLAREIHEASTRHAQPFVHVDCASLAPSMIESELFGHERGAFTGASNRRVGRFELASCGTIFLDEIAELPVELQVKLLRVLQEHSFERVGGSLPPARWLSLVDHQSRCPRRFFLTVINNRIPRPGRLSDSCEDQKNS